MPEKASKLLPSLYGGVIIGVIAGLPFLGLLNCFCCAGVMLGGLMSVFFYKNDLTSTMPPLTSNDSLQLGLLAGVFGAVFGTLIHGMILAAFGDITTGTLLHILRGLEGRIPPEALEQIENSMSHSAGLGMLSLVTTFFVSLILYPLFGLIGGLIGYSLFKPKQMATPPSNPQTPTSI